MIRPAQLLAVAAAEIRLTRRLVRYWVFLVLAGLGALLAYVQISFLHGFLSTYSSTIAALNPRFLIGFLGLRYLVLFTVGVVFLGFDVRARDVREQMDEVLDSRPFSNLELLGGRFLGLLAVAWVPLVAVTLAVDGLGALLRALHVPFGDTMEPWSLLGMAVVMAVPALAFAIGLVFFLSLLVRNRLVAAILLLAILGGCFWAILYLPIASGPCFDLWGAYIVDYPSDIVPSVATGVAWLQRLGVLLAGLALVVLAAAVHPRADDAPRARQWAAGGGLLVLGVALMGVVAHARWADLDQLQAWKAAHEAVRAEAAPDLEAVVADLVLDPGDGLRGSVELSFRAPAGVALERCLFTLNPGLVVSAATAGSGAPVSFTQGDGLLSLAQPVAVGGAQRVRLELAGRLDRRFAYLDAATTPEALNAMDGAIFLLGFERAIDDRRHVALLPGVRWLPAAGGDVGRDDPATRPRDYFDLDLSVEVPSGWLAAGPGRRETVAAVAGGARFRFRPGAPVDGAALVAGRFAAFAVEVAGVPCEVLLHPAHVTNLAVLADAEAELVAAARELLEEAAAAGLPYPYSGFTLVEVPAALRGFAGGWRLDTAMAPPAMLLLRETGLPSARFDVAFAEPEDFADREGGLPRAIRSRVRLFFMNDFSGGNLFTGVARNLLLNQSSAAGREAMALNFALEELATLVLSGQRGYFSAHLYDQDMGERVQSVLTSSLGNFGGDTGYADTMINALAARPAVWDAVLATPLVELDPWADPARTVDALVLKAGAMSSALFDALGRARAAALLAELRRTASGRSFAFAELAAAAEALAPGTGAMLADWLESTELPAFVGGAAQVYRLPDGADGGARYQILAEVRNQAAPRGVLRFSYRVGSEGSTEEAKSEPITVDGRQAIRWGTVVSRPPVGLWVEPYLSLNREPFRLPLPELDQAEVVAAEPVEGVAVALTPPPVTDVITVDDLDPGFSVASDDQGWGLRLLGRGAELELDAGLPVDPVITFPPRWSRADSATAWGAYRHTVAYKKAGKGAARATFTAELPRSGSWELELHLCHKDRFRAARTWGTWQLTVSDGRDTSEVEFDAEAAARGWNQVGRFELAGGEVTVTLSDASKGQVVVADAIRWVPHSAAVAVASGVVTEGMEE